MNESDYIVVGGGTAGCVVAARLAGRGCSVTLLEAGGPYSRVLDIPLVGLWAWLRRPQRYSWTHWTVPQSSLGGRSVWYPGGRIVGGSSAINAMIDCRGHRSSYDRWGVGAHVSRILIERERAVGIEYLHGGGVHTARAGREVILCAGTVKSPQILQLSGIGPAQDLRRQGVSVVVDLPGVGANLQDHVRVPIMFRVARRRYTFLPALLAASPRYLLRRRGLLASNVADAAAIVRTAASAEVPDLRVVFIWRAMPEQPGTLVAFETGLIDPHSRGHVRLASADPSKGPLIDPNYFADPRDRTRMEIGIELARRIAQTSACREAGINAEFLPADRPLAEHIRENAASSYHPVGTCRMGSDEMAVVDPELRVMGVGALRVVDASVMPTTVTGNAQAAVLAIAERATDLLLSPLGK